MSQSERESSQLVLDSVTFKPQWIHQDGRECARIGFFLVSGVGAETKERVCADGVCALSSEHRVCVREWLVIAMEVRNQAGEGRAYGSLGMAYQWLGDFVKVIEHHTHHLSIAQELSTRAEEGGEWWNLGLCMCTDSSWIERSYVPAIVAMY